MYPLGMRIGALPTSDGIIGYGRGGHPKGSTQVRRVCIFCGARSGIDNRHIRAAFDMGQLLAGAGFELVYGGSASGCMGALADGAIRANGRVIGIVPELLLAGEERHSHLFRLDLVADLATRKLRMLGLTDAVVVLPGGTGTLDELLEALTMKRLGLIHHEILVLNTNGFFDPLIHFMRQMIEQGFADESQLSLLRLFEEPAALLHFLSSDSR
jgi:uncharacterized protein (TIGR00730 family)